MSDKLKIFAIYACVAVLSAGIIAMAMYAGKSVKGNAEIVANQGKSTELPVYTSLSEGIEVTNQRGEQMNLEDLQGKVWIFAQFYAACPQCAKRNFQDLKILYDEHASNPDFRMVCISVNPEQDNVERLREYAETFDSPENWLFLTGDPEKLMTYMEKQMLYPTVKVREDKEEIALYGQFAHDMSLAVFDRDLQMRGKFDLFNSRESKPELYKNLRSELNKRVNYYLQQK